MLENNAKIKLDQVKIQSKNMLVAKEKAQIDDNNWNGRAMRIHKDRWGFQATVAKKEVRR